MWLIAAKSTSQMMTLNGLQAILFLTAIQSSWIITRFDFKMHISYVSLWSIHAGGISVAKLLNCVIIISYLELQLCN